MLLKEKIASLKLHYFKVLQVGQQSTVARSQLLHLKRTTPEHHMALTIKTNWTPRELITGQWLEGFGGLNSGSLYHQLRREFDYLSEEEFDSGEFFKYRGVWYDFSEFMRLENNSPFGNKWDGYSSDSYFSGIVVKNCFDGNIIVGTYLS